MAMRVDTHMEMRRRGLGLEVEIDWRSDVGPLVAVGCVTLYSEIYAVGVLV